MVIYGLHSIRKACALFPDRVHSFSEKGALCDRHIHYYLKKLIKDLNGLFFH